MTETINLTAAIQYVTEHGTILERARLLYLLMGEPPALESYKKLIDSQRADGGFPSRPKIETPSAVDSTLTALWQFEELGMMDSDYARRAFDFLRAMQQPDGGLDENPTLPEHDLPPWIVPGELSTRLYLTTYAAYWFGLVQGPADPAFSRAVAFVASHQRADGAIPGYLHNNWLGASAFLLASGGGYAQEAEKILAYLLALPATEWADSQISWALDCLSRAGLPQEHPFIRFALAELIRRQAADGSWASDDGPAFAASATVGAISVLKRMGLLGGLEDWG